MALNTQLQTYQILTNNDQMLIVCLSYFVTTVIKDEKFYSLTAWIRRHILRIKLWEL